MNIVHIALRLAANERMRAHGTSYWPLRTEPEITRRHIDGPYIGFLDGTMRWLGPWERLLTKLGIWDAWDIEYRSFPL